MGRIFQFIAGISLLVAAFKGKQAPSPFNPFPQPAPYPPYNPYLPNYRAMANGAGNGAANMGGASACGCRGVWI